MSVLDYIEYRKSDSSIGLKNFLIYFGNFYAITIKNFREKKLDKQILFLASRWTRQVHYNPLVVPYIW